MKALHTYYEETEYEFYDDQDRSIEVNPYYFTDNNGVYVNA